MMLLQMKMVMYNSGASVLVLYLMDVCVRGSGRLQIYSISGPSTASPSGVFHLVSTLR